MKLKLLLLFSFLNIILGCTTINVGIPPVASGGTGTYTINVIANREVPITNTASPSGNTVPIGK